MMPWHFSHAERELVERLASLRKTEDAILRGNKGLLFNRLLAFKLCFFFYWFITVTLSWKRDKDIKDQSSNVRSKSKMHWWKSVKDMLWYVASSSYCFFFFHFKCMNM